MLVKGRLCKNAIVTVRSRVAWLDQLCLHSLLQGGYRAFCEINECESPSCYLVVRTVCVHNCLRFVVVY